jgi:tRNA pseudouridine13 synthase
VKLKRLPQDFQVEELAALEPATGGPYALYRLTKRSMGTLEVLEALSRRWRIARPRISFGGLKDRYAIAHQHVSILHGPRRDLRQKSFALAYLGQCPHPFTAESLRGNRFALVIRSLTPAAGDAALAALERVRVEGMPNYFDDQRFGSVGAGGEFVAQPWMAGDFELALRLALAEPNPADRPRHRAEKESLRQRWGDWAACLEASPRWRATPALRHLVHRPGDFKGAFARLSGDLRGLYLSAYQGHLWNQMLALLIRERCPQERLFDVRLRLLDVPMFRGLDQPTREALAAAELPLPSARVRGEPGAELAERVLAEAGLTLASLRIRAPRENFFARGLRRAVVQPGELTHRIEPDDLEPQRQKLTLSFELPRGSFATILVKGITARLRPETPADPEPPAPR